MTRVAVIADIHANLPALEAVIEDIEAADVDEVMVAGDLVGRGPQGRAVIDRVREMGWRSIRGNHEDYTLQFRRHDVPNEWLTDEIWAASRWMARELDDSHAEYIDRLPFTGTPDLAPELRLFHGSPRSYNEGIGHWTSDSTLSEYLDSIEESILVCAHTHRPIERRLPSGLVVNVGSVGLPFNGDPRAQYVVFQRSGGWDVEFRQVVYDRQRFLSIYEESGFLEEGGLTARILKREVETARPFLVPFLKWTEIEDVEPDEENYAEFLDFYDPEMSMSSMFEKFGDSPSGDD